MSNMALKLRFLGGTREIGRTSILVTNSDKSLLFDYGVALDHEPGFPMHVRPREVDAIILTHAHLDHSGALPAFFVSRYIPTYATPVTYELTRILVQDFLRISGPLLPYEYIDLESMLNHGFRVPYDADQRIGDLSFRLLDAGHIPGSAQILLSVDGKKILFTGDFNTVPTRLLKPAVQDYGKVDAVIVESTYADEDHPKREIAENEFIEEIRQVVEGGGRVLIPAFAVGRAQEILCVLRHHRMDWPTAVDGMARRVNDLIREYPSYLRDDLFSEALKSVIVVKGRRDRKKVVRKAKIIVSPAGMLKGGPVHYYMKQLAMDERNAVFLVSFQIPGTPGRILRETGKIILNGEEKRIKARVNRFGFSSHCGRSQLQAALRKIDGNPCVFTIHGAQGNCEKLAKWTHDELGLTAFAPEAGEVHEL